MAEVRSEREQLQQLERVVAEHDFARALVLAERILGDFPHSFQARLQYARVLKELHRLDEAGALLGDLDREYGGNLAVLVELGDLQFRQKRYPESREVFQRVLFLDSFNRRAKATLAYIERLLENPGGDRMEDTSVEFRLPRTAPAAPPVDPNEQTAPEVILTSTEVVLTPTEEITFDRGDSRPAAAGGTRADAVDFSRQPTLAEDELESIFGLAEEKAAPPAQTDRALDELFADLGAGALTVEPPGEAPPAHSPADTNVPLPPVADAPAVPASAPAPMESLDFETASAAELYLQQGLYDEAEAIFAKLFGKTGRDEYQARIEEVHRLRRTERAMRTIERMLAFLQALQKRGSARV